MRIIYSAMVGIVLGAVSITVAEAACKGSNGRGWGSGKGAGQFAMSAADGACRISFPGFIDERTNKRTPATQVKITKAPRSGKVEVVPGKGLRYIPAKGFKGRDTFCTSNRAPKMKGTLAGCVTVTVR